MSKDFVSVGPHRRAFPKRKFADGGTTAAGRGIDPTDPDYEGAINTYLAQGYPRDQAEDMVKATGANPVEPFGKPSTSLLDLRARPSAPAPTASPEEAQPVGPPPAPENTLPTSRGDVPGVKPRLPKPAASSFNSSAWLRSLAGAGLGAGSGVGALSGAALGLLLPLLWKSKRQPMDEKPTPDKAAKGGPIGAAMAKRTMKFQAGGVNPTITPIENPGMSALSRNPAAGRGMRFQGPGAGMGRGTGMGGPPQFQGMGYVPPGGLPTPTPVSMGPGAGGPPPGAPAGPPPGGFPSGFLSAMGPGALGGPPPGAGGPPPSAGAASLAQLAAPSGGFWGPGGTPPPSAMGPPPGAGNYPSLSLIGGGGGLALGPGVTGGPPPPGGPPPGAAGTMGGMTGAPGQGLSPAMVAALLQKIQGAQGGGPPPGGMPPGGPPQFQSMGYVPPGGLPPTTPVGAPPMATGGPVPYRKGGFANADMTAENLPSAPVKKAKATLTRKPKGPAIAIAISHKKPAPVSTPSPYDYEDDEGTAPPPPAPPMAKGGAATAKAKGGTIKKNKGGECADKKMAKGGVTKLAAGGAAKQRRGFPNTQSPPKRLAAGGKVRGCGVATKGCGFSGVY